MFRSLLPVSAMLASASTTRAFAPLGRTALRATASRLFAATASADVKPEETALVCIEFQNDFASEGGALHDAVKAEMARVKTMENAKKVVEAARDRGVKVMHAPLLYSDDYKEMPNRYGILAGVLDTQAFKRSAWGGEFAPGMGPEGSDIVVEGKCGLDTFPGSNLKQLLDANGIKKVAICGFLTNCCVESTMRTSFESGFDVVTLPDACCATSEAEHLAATEGTFNMFSKTMSTDEFLASL